MTRRNLLQSTALLATPALQAADTPIDIASRRELFTDRFLIARMQGSDLRLGQPYDAGPVLALDRPWEGRFCGYATIIQDGATYRLYYRGVPNAGQDGRNEEVTCYAESTDGIHFTRPDLGIYEIHGTRKNNVILANTPPLQHNFCPFLDTRPGVPPDQRFKALAGTSRSGLIAYQSGDGIHWKKMRDEAVLTKGAFDSQNLAFWSESEQTYLCYYRTFKPVGGQRYRWISRAVSKDFVNWEYQGEMSFGDAPPEHLYTNQTSAYYRAPHIYVSICARFMPGRQVLSEAEARAVNVDPDYFKDCSDAVLLTSRGGMHYDRTFLDAFIRPGLGFENWVSRSNYPALNVISTGSNEMSLYVVRNYGQPSIYLRRYTLRPDGFASVHAPYAGGEMVTKPLRFQGSKLEINFSTSAPGSVRVEIQDAAGAPIPGFAMADAREMIGDLVDRAVSWKQGASVSALAGKTVRLRFALKDADLYSLRFS
ncbi:MAG: hypothetical protein U0Q16_38765 [Bryobacteraceae bacterium]